MWENIGKAVHFFEFLILIGLCMILVGIVEIPRQLNQQSAVNSHPIIAAVIVI